MRPTSVMLRALPMAVQRILVGLALTGCSRMFDASSSESGNAVDDTLALVSSLGSIATSVGTTGMAIDSARTGHALEQRREIKVAIARGQGPFVTDLAAWLALPDAMVPALGKALRDARPVLEPALSTDLTEHAFELLLGVALCSDPTLRYHAWRRFDCMRLAPLAAPTSP